MLGRKFQHPGDWMNNVNKKCALWHCAPCTEKSNCILLHSVLELPVWANVEFACISEKQHLLSQCRFIVYIPSYSHIENISAILKFNELDKLFFLSTFPYSLNFNKNVIMYRSEIIMYLDKIIIRCYIFYLRIEIDSLIKSRRSLDFYLVEWLNSSS